MPETVFTVSAVGAGQRLDKALGAVFPDMGIRGCRRFWERGQVLVNGRARPRGWSVAAGDVVTVRLPDAADAGDAAARERGSERPRVLAERGDWVFLYKPAGLHSAALAGSGARSLEDMLPRLCGCPTGTPVLLNRLDQGTSGVVVASRTTDGALLWRRGEDAGQCEKRYLAVLEGRLEMPLVMSRALNTARRATTVVLADEGEPLRHTRLTPLGVLEGGDARRVFPDAAGNAALTLAGCLIRKGARHQIRAHAAHAGYPLAGDERYGARRKGAFLLHHGALRLGGAAPAPICEPVWLERLSEALRAAARAWLNTGE